MAISTYGIYLMIKEGTTYQKLVDIKEFPDLGGAPEMLETTTLTDNMQTYIPGIQQLEALTFTANYELDVFKDLQKLDRVQKDYAVWLGHKMATPEPEPAMTPDGNQGKLQFQGYLSVFPNGSGVNEVVDMTITIAPSSPVTLS